MNRLILLTLTSFLIFRTGDAQNAQQILGIAKEVKSIEYYEEQSLVWESMTQSSPFNENAWLNYYRAKRAYYQKHDPDLWSADQQAVFSRLQPIVNACEKATGKSYTYHYIASMNEKGDGAFQHLKKAFAIDPNQSDIHGELFVHYVKQFNEEEAELLAKKLLNTNHYSNAMLKWNYNALQSAEKNSVFLTHGDMDTLPRWVLQYGLNIRRDIIVANKYSMAWDKKYRQHVFLKLNLIAPRREKNESLKSYSDRLAAYILQNSSRPAYIGTGTNVQFFKDNGIEDNMYLVGLAFKYSTSSFDNMRTTIENFESRYDLEYILNNFQRHPSDDVVKKHMNMTYIPALIKLVKYFDKHNASAKSQYYASLIERIAQESGRKEEIKSWY